MVSIFISDEAILMDVFDAEKRSAIMRSVKGKNTKPEMLVRCLLHRAGFRYRLHRADLPGKPDLSFPARRKAIFVHGCFWHQHPGCQAADRPAGNREYWDKKLNRNVERDAAHLEALAQIGWSVLIVWECETRDLTQLLETVSEFLNE